MRRQPPIIRCFSALCVLSAATLIALEWHNPFPEPVVTPDRLGAISSESTNSRQGASAQAAEGSTQTHSTETKSSGGGFWAGPKQTKVPLQTPIRLSLSLEGRYLEVAVPTKPVVRYEVAIGQEDWQTPTGEFEITSKIENPAWIHPITKEEIPPGPDNPLGERWIGFWSDGETQIGFHGTNQEELIGEAVSHGCVRMRNEDIKQLYELIEVGTPVVVSL
ncbi:MAG: L,D-transpeptidase [Phormidesmis sp.]